MLVKYAFELKTLTSGKTLQKMCIDTYKKNKKSNPSSPFCMAATQSAQPNSVAFSKKSMEIGIEKSPDETEPQSARNLAELERIFEDQRDGKKKKS